MPKYAITRIKSKPGVQRDNTAYNAEAYINAQWMRIYEGVPRKIGGYQLIEYGGPDIIRNLFTVPRSQSIDLYIGRRATVGFLNITYAGISSTETDRTPITDFVPDDNNLWMFDLYTGGPPDNINYIFAHAAPNALNITNPTDGTIFFGDVSLTTPLMPVLDIAGDPVQVSGGIVYLSPFMIAYGNDGVIVWSPISPSPSPTGWDTLNDQLTIANTKIVRGYRTRSDTPTALFWSLNSLVRVTYSPSLNTFTSSTVEENITVMSPNCIVQYNQMFFWIGTDQFYFFNGIVQKLTNTMNNDFFFENVNKNARGKIWGLSIPRYKEIWWHYPAGTSEECNKVIIYNVESDIWYDSVLGRSAGVQTSVFPYPLMADAEENAYPGYIIPDLEVFPLWMHEKGTDRVVSNNAFAIPSYFETHQMDLFSNANANSNLLRSRRIVPDFEQIGPMTVTVNYQMYPNSPVLSDGPYTFNSTVYNINGSVQTQGTEFIDLASQGALVSFLFESNIQGGFYMLGKTLYFYNEGDTLK